MALSIGTVEDATGPRDALSRARQRAALVPDLLVDAQRIANTVSAGWHGRRRRGSGDTFWQFRPYDTGESLSRIDWRRSARDDAITVRDQEWEAAHTAWVWADNSASMLYRSQNAPVSKQARGLVLALALAELLARSGERVGWPGLTRPLSSRNAAERIATELTAATVDDGPRPQSAAIRARSELVVVSDFLEPVADTLAWMDDTASARVRGTLIHIIDPAEHAFPFSGRTEFSDPETGAKLTFGRAETLGDDYRTAFSARGEALAANARRLGWRYIAHRTDELASSALVAAHMQLSEGGGE
ncbi:DUF58 domain-containing protein [Rhizobiaceae bacterium]|nr:DUF58 domain-containing protein [Rhizobiaceae bacterium]